MPWISQSTYDLIQTVRFDIARVERKLDILSRAEEGRAIMSQADIDALRSTVEENNSVIDSAVVLINGLAAQIRDLSDDPAQLRTLADSLDQKSGELAAAVTANTAAPPA